MSRGSLALAVELTTRKLDVEGFVFAEVAGQRWRAKSFNGEHVLERTETGLVSRERFEGSRRLAVRMVEMSLRLSGRCR